MLGASYHCAWRCIHMHLSHLSLHPIFTCNVIISSTRLLTHSSQQPLSPPTSGLTQLPQVDLEHCAGVAKTKLHVLWLQDDGLPSLLEANKHFMFVLTDRSRLCIWSLAGREAKPYGVAGRAVDLPSDLTVMSMRCNCDGTKVCRRNPTSTLVVRMHNYSATFHQQTSLRCSDT